MASSWPDLHDRVERAEFVENIFAGIAIVPALAIHDEHVFMASRRQDEPLFPQPRVRVAGQAQAGRLPVIETAADIDVLGAIAFQDEVNLVTLRFRGWRLYFCFAFLTLFFFRFWHKQFVVSSREDVLLAGPVAAPGSCPSELIDHLKIKAA
jgi:hypothetical protein